MLIVSKRKVKIDKLKAQLNNGFVKYLEEAKKILGMEIQRDRRKGMICLTRTQFLKKILQRFGVNGKTKPASTHLAPYFKLIASLSLHTEDENKHIAQILYTNALSALMYAMVCLRPKFHMLSIW